MDEYGALLRSKLETYPASDRLKAQLRKRPRTSAPRWAAVAAVAVIALAVGVTRGVTVNGERSRVLSDEVLASHVRSLMGTHLLDVTSSDQHTVKPWFNGRLDFSPPVYDFAGAGYPLVGGRMDYIARRPVAALVYARRKHLINVFLWPKDEGPTSGAAQATRQGYHMLHFTVQDYTYWVVSDLGTVELQQFSRLLQQSQ